MPSFASLISEFIPESFIKNLLRSFYYEKLWFKRGLKELSNWESLLRKHRIAIKIDAPYLGSNKIIGSKDPKYIFYAGSDIYQESVSRSWYYSLFKYLSKNKQKKLLE